MVRLASVILAAGRGTRMKSSLPKVLHVLAGKPLLSYPIEIAKKFGAKPVCVLIPPDRKTFEPHLATWKVTGVVQKEPKGTADAVFSAKKSLSGFQGYVLILCGDVPLLRFETVKAFVERLLHEKRKLGLMTMRLETPGSYGRVMRDLEGKIVGIVEAKEATVDQQGITEVNTGIYCVEKEWLFQTLQYIKPAKVSEEYYLTDIVTTAAKQGEAILGHMVHDSEEFLGVNTRVDLAHVTRLMQQRLHETHMLAGVTFLDATSVFLDDGVVIGEDTVISPGVTLLGKTRIGRHCVLENGVFLKDTLLGDYVHVKPMSVIEESRIDQHVIIGPFARIRPGSHLEKNVRVGNFVEIKKTKLKQGSKANHLSYLGDATIGAHTNIGCGTITCNYDGHAKHQTIIGEHVFVGSDVQFVAPVRIGRKATIGAGSTITENVPADALAIARAKQVVVKGWKPKWKRKKSRRS